ncbi:MAG: hypothetical protein N2202_08050 [Proteobacteria bacterium]|nr:hypothetical protein [Pseudomonadota bacterium]
MKREIWIRLKTSLQGKQKVRLSNGLCPECAKNSMAIYDYLLHSVKANDQRNFYVIIFPFL